MKNFVKNSIVGLFLAAVLAYTTHCFDTVLLDEYLVFALLASMALTFEIRNPVVSFAVLTGTCIGMAFYNVEYVFVCYPAALFFWSASLCRNEKVPSVYIALAQAGFAASLCFSIVNRIKIGFPLGFLVNANKLIIVPIYILVHIVLQSFAEKQAKRPKDKTVYKNKKTIMVFAYLWSVVYLIDMALRYKNTISCVMLLVCATAYAVYFEEPMIRNAYPALKNAFSKEDTAAGTTNAKKAR